ncbi:MAG: PBP1A family penicillin-binding protein [Deltaproteobacteria bacterium]|nr:PBP1A family penicillin-binding protein [Deltaproteobacteria bacterium]
MSEPSTSDTPPGRRGRRSEPSVLRWLRRLATVAFCLAGVGCIALAGMLRHYENRLPSTADLSHYDPPQVTRILARDGSLLAEVFVERRTVVAIDAIPKALKLAVLAAEDADFYRHEGLDYIGMLRALVVNLRHGETRQGGSTITQQVVKNALLTSERTFERKARELLLARRIEQELSKDQILELYLNHIYFGHGRHGVEEAARYYFGKSVGQLRLSEAAMIAGLPKGPNLFSPRVDLERATRRRNTVLEQMAQKGFAEREVVERAKIEPVLLAPAVEQLAELAPEVVDEVQRVLKGSVGPDAQRGGFTVTTTIDPELQAAARAAVRKNLDAYAARHGLVAPLRPRKKQPVPFKGTPKAAGHPVYEALITGADDATGTLTLDVGTARGTARIPARYDPKGGKASAFAPVGTMVRVSPIVDRGVGEDGVPREYRLELGPESGLVLADVATQEVLAMVGSYEGVRGGFDRATYAKRQPGSTFKPFVYAEAIRARKLTPASIVPLPEARNPNKPLPLPGRDPSDPANLAKPPLFLREALARSVNEAATWALHEAGAPAVVALANGMGLRAELKPTDSLALGAYETTPRELATAYLTFASGGVTSELRLVRSITASDGRAIALPAPVTPRRVLTEAESYLATHLLTSVIERGTGRAARGLGVPLAGKTGTSNEAKDAWFAGYSPTTVCVVWTGYDDSVPLGSTEQGATAALPAFVDAMRAAHRGKKPAPWKEPEGLVRRKIDRRTGLLAREGAEDATEELFLAGTEPKETAPAPEDGGGGAGGAPGTGGAEPAPIEEPPPRIDAPGSGGGGPASPPP